MGFLFFPLAFLISRGYNKDAMADFLMEFRLRPGPDAIRRQGVFSA